MSVLSQSAEHNFCLVSFVWNLIDLNTQQKGLRYLRKSFNFHFTTLQMKNEMNEHD